MIRGKWGWSQFHGMNHGSKARSHLRNKNIPLSSKKGSISSLFFLSTINGKKKRPVATPLAPSLQASDDAFPQYHEGEAALQANHGARLPLRNSPASQHRPPLRLQRRRRLSLRTDLLAKHSMLSASSTKARKLLP